MASFEQEKFDMQKQHTRSMQELLDDTNSRLQRMEEEYAEQMQQTVSFVCVLSLLQSADGGRVC